MISPTRFTEMEIGVKCAAYSALLAALSGHADFLIWAYVHSIPTLKFLRRKAALSITDVVNCWNCAISNLLTELQRCLSSSRTVLFQCPVSPTYMYTDSCLSGWGVVLFDGNSIAVFAGPWNVHEDIAILEARALLRGVERLPPPRG